MQLLTEPIALVTALMARRATASHSQIVDTAADGRFHGPQRCTACGQALEGQTWGTMVPLSNGVWIHDKCLHEGIAT